MFWNHVHKQLSAYLHDELSAEQSSRVAKHLLQCQRCRAEYEEIRFGARMAARLTEETAPESLWHELNAALNSSGQTAARSAPFPLWQLAAGGAAVVLIGFGIYRWHRLAETSNRPSWEVTRLEGQPAIGKRTIKEKGRLALDEWLTTDGASRAQLSVGEIGEVKIDPDSRVRLAAAQGDEHRLELARGKIEAFIWAPPRQFFVDTPSARAVDLGCSYTLEVDDRGEGLMHVTMGWVAFEWQGRESFVPAGASCITRPALGPGTPWFDDASKEFQEALGTFDRGESSALKALLAQARKRDGLTLWHLLAHAREEQRGTVFDRLAELIPPPKTATREGMLRGDRAMLDAWWKQLGLGDAEWWRMWKGPLIDQQQPIREKP